MHSKSRSTIEKPTHTGKLRVAENKLEADLKSDNRWWAAGMLGSLGAGLSGVTFLAGGIQTGINDYEHGRPIDGSNLAEGGMLLVLSAGLLAASVYISHQISDTRDELRDVKRDLRAVPSSQAARRPNVPPPKSRAA